MSVSETSTPASASTSVAENETIILADDVKKYDAEKLISFLRKQELGLSEEVIKILKSNDVTGRAFLQMTKQDFQDINLKAGPALVLANFAKESKGKKSPPPKLSKRLNLDSYNTIPLENWSCNKLVEYYRDNLERKDWSCVLDSIKKDLIRIADSNSGFSVERRRRAQTIIDHWTHWRTSPKKFSMDLKRDYSQFKIDTLQVRQQMIATGVASTQIVDNRKYRRNDNGEAVLDDIPDDIKRWSPDHVKKFLESRVGNSDYNETDIEKIRKQDLTGRAFLRLTEEKLTRNPGLYELKPSPAEGIMELVEELNQKLAKDT